MSAPSPNHAPIDPQLRIGSVHLAVSDLGRSVDFYENVLGLPLISRGDEEAILGPDREAPLLQLTRLHEPTVSPPRSSGLFHVALLHPSRGDLAETVLRIAAARWPLTGASDHGVSEAIYLDDPDGLGLEIYADRPREQWPAPDGADPVRMFTLPLDLRGLLATAREDLAPAISAGTVVGHVHLKVSDVDRAVRFYRDVLGFDLQAHLPSAAFVAAGGYHHHFGLNTWQSLGAPPAPLTAPGLRLVELQVSDVAALDALQRRLADAGVAEVRRDGDLLSLHDDDHQALSLSVTRVPATDRAQH
jgi:catechol 2,3-dioxygenase